ncbi:MAG: NADH:flavin oxidoreductase [Candidatus Aminicenantes bacterium]|nr:NADH:flavin oxidoreductase [Candidatus Aminicenantes bacterium]
MNTSSALFQTIRLGSQTLANRFARSATHDFMAREDGTVDDRQVALYRELARGEVGLIITGHAFFRPEGKASPRQMGVHEDRMVEGLSRISGAVHAFPAKVLLQIAHAGRQTKERICGGRPVAPSAVFDPVSGVLPRALNADEVAGLVGDFVAAAGRARAAGFDGVQIHAAHGYLLSSFLSPHTNRRRDEWGGSPDNRARIVVEIVRGIRNGLGRDFPVIIKINADDFLEDGVRVKDCVRVCRTLEAEGLDGFEISGGMAEAGRGSIWPGLRSEADEGYFLDAAARVKASVSVPVLGLGGWRTFRAMERAVEAGRADIVSLSRPLVRDPHLIRKFRTGELDRSDCVSCNKCLNPRGLRCRHES